MGDQWQAIADGSAPAGGMAAAPALSTSALIDHFPGLAAFLSPDGSVQHLNRELLDYFGQSLDDLRNWASNGTIHPEDLDHLVREFGAAIASGTPYDIEQRMRRHDGEYRWISNRGVPLRSDAGTVLGWLVLLSDIHDRKSAEAALSASEQKLRLIVDTIPVLAWSANADGTSDFFNQLYLDYSGRDLDSLGGMEWANLVHPDDRQAVLDTWERCSSSGESGQTEARLRRDDGEYRWFHFHACPLHDEDGKVLKWYGVNTDIHDRKSAEEQLAARELKLRETLDHLGQAQRLSRTGSFTTDVNSDSHVWSDQLYDILGYKRSEKPSFKAFRSKIHRDDLEAFDAAFAKSMADRSEFDETFRIVPADGSVKFLHAIAHFVHGDSSRPTVIGTIQDITSAKLVENELRRSEYLLTTSERISETGSFIWDLDQDKVIHSEQYWRIYELEQDAEIPRDYFRNLYHPDDLPLVDEKIAKVMRGEQCPPNIERLLMSDGRVKYVSTAFRVVKHEDGRRECFGVAQDVTRRIVAENGLAELRTELAHITRISSLGELAASIAHEVNQPLSGIITNASACLRLLAADPPNIEAAAATAERSIRDGNRAAEVIRRLRGMYRRHDYAPELFDLNEAAQEVMAICAHDLQRRRIILKSDLAPQLPEVMGDRIQLQQVILNLVLNAADAIDQVSGPERQVLIATSVAENSSVVLSVRDSGPGIARGDRPRLFDPFFTTKPTGMGIGLSVSKSIIERHNGVIGIEDDGLPGATFSFSIPSAPDEVPAPRKGDQDESGSA